MIRATPQFASVFPGIQDPDRYSCNRQAAGKAAAVIPSVRYPFNIPDHVAVMEWKNGRTRVPQDPKVGPPESHLKPPQPDGNSWVLRDATSGPNRVTLVGPCNMEPNVRVMEWFNEDSGEVRTLGPDSGIFLAQTNKCKKAYAYDAKIMYDAKQNIMDAKSSIKLQHEFLKETYAAKSRLDPSASGEVPPPGQFTKHYHAFIRSQVRMLVFVAYTQSAYISHAHVADSRSPFTLAQGLL